jgi:hypothetical protein
MQSKKIIKGFAFAVVILFISVSYQPVIAVENKNSESLITISKNDKNSTIINSDDIVLHNIFLRGRNLDGGWIDFYWENGANWRFEWSGTLIVFELFKFRLHKFDSGLNGEIKHFKGHRLAYSFGDETPTYVFGFAKTLILYRQI